MDRIVCQGPCGESKPEIAFELSRGKLRKKCRACRSAEKSASKRRCRATQPHANFATGQLRGGLTPPYSTIEGTAVGLANRFAKPAGHRKVSRGFNSLPFCHSHWRTHATYSVHLTLFQTFYVAYH